MMRIHHPSIRRPQLLSICVAVTLLAACDSDKSGGSRATEPDIGGAAVSAELGCRSPFSVVPAPDTRGVGVAENIQINFGTALMPSSVNNANFRLERSGVVLPSKVSMSGNRATINPDGLLPESSRITVSLGVGIVNTEGDPVADCSWVIFTEGSGWAPDEQIDPPAREDANGNALFGGIAFRPQIDFADNGDGMAVWQQGIDKDGIFARKYVADENAWGDTQVLFPQGSVLANNPRISVAPNGDAIAVWVQGSEPIDLYSATYSASTNTWQNPELRETDDMSALLPSVSIDANGNAIAVWAQGGSILADRYVAATQTWQGIQMLETSSTEAAQPRISMDDSGNAIAVWLQNNDMVANRYDVASASWEGPVALDNSVSVASDPAISLDADGNAIAVWAQSGDIFSNRYVIAGNAGWMEAQRIEPLGGGTAFTPQISTDSNGDAIVVWNEYSGNITDGVYTNRYTAGTSSWAEVPLRLAQLGEQDSIEQRPANPQISIGPNGDAFAVWSQYDAVYFSRYQVSAGRWTILADPLVSDGLNGSANIPQIGVGNNGTAIAIWVLNTDGANTGTSAGSTGNIRASVFNEDNATQ